MNLKSFKDVYQKGTCRYSIEIFPPKDSVDSLFAALNELKTLNPAFVSVTYGAMGSTRDLTRDLAIRIKKEMGLDVASHFTCVGSSRAQIREYVTKLNQEGINLVVALRGDPPLGGVFKKPTDGFEYANELVSYLKTLDGFSLAVAGYPEKHIEAPSLEIDLANLKRKVDAGADIIITQLFFDNRVYFDFVDRARKAGITIPIIPGIMPILSSKQLEKISSLCGASVPESLLKRLIDASTENDAQREIGVAHAIEQCFELKKSGVPGIHFYAMNKAYSVKKVIEAL